MTNREKKLIEMLKKVTFIAESVAHMRGMEREILPVTDAARELLVNILNPSYSFELVDKLESGGASPSECGELRAKLVEIHA